MAAHWCQDVVIILKIKKCWCWRAWNGTSSNSSRLPATSPDQARLRRFLLLANGLKLVTAWLAAVLLGQSVCWAWRHRCSYFVYLRSQADVRTLSRHFFKKRFAKCLQTYIKKRFFFLFRCRNWCWQSDINNLINVIFPSLLHFSFGPNWWEPQQSVFYGLTLLAVRVITIGHLDLKRPLWLAIWRKRK